MTLTDGHRPQAVRKSPATASVITADSPGASVPSAPTAKLPATLLSSSKLQPVRSTAAAPVLVISTNSPLTPLYMNSVMRTCAKAASAQPARLAASAITMAILMQFPNSKPAVRRRPRSLAVGSDASVTAVAATADPAARLTSCLRAGAAAAQESANQRPRPRFLRSVRLRFRFFALLAAVFGLPLFTGNVAAGPIADRISTVTLTLPATVANTMPSYCLG